MRDGTPIYLRQVQASDHRHVAAGFAQLSMTSRMFRFFRSRERLSDEELRYLTNVDQLNHVAWCALDSPAVPFQGLGIGRMIRDASHPNSAEMAITVIDAYQGRGLGTILLAILCIRAKALGIQRLRAFVLPDNIVVARWLTNLGAKCINNDGFLEFDVQTDQTTGLTNKTATLIRFETLTEQLQKSMEKFSLE